MVESFIGVRLFDGISVFRGADDANDRGIAASGITERTSVSGSEAKACGAVGDLGFDGVKQR